ncbi:uncharacterized protein LOC106136181 [Amyelois transitella]|uniref:uncharacterized protein LOC106136181 n=1 Tax=Amyelois transitella TaxID=680683 RepID=UPI00298FE3DA|nr:uncharacterized protein LOC106136181 [Amyelois transitella]
MDANNITEIKDGDETRPSLVDTPSMVEIEKPKLEGNLKKKRRRGKSKRKVLKPFIKAPWQDRRKNDKSKRNNRFRKIVLAKTRAPFNNNQFLMEIHKPEPENSFQILNTPSARTRDSSFSVDSEENYFFSLPEDEEEYLTKEFSSVYEDAQSERLSNMSKNELIQEYLLLEAKYETFVKRTERSRLKNSDNDRDMIGTDKDTSATDKDSMLTERDTSGTSIVSSIAEEESLNDLMQRLKEQEEQILQLKKTNEKLQMENDQLRQRSHASSSEDSESDSSSSSDSCSTSSRSISPLDQLTVQPLHEMSNGNQNLQENGIHSEELEPEYPLVNGFHNPDN